MLILAIAEYLNKLFEDSSMASVTSLGELRRVMEMTIDFALVLVIRILGAENGGAY